MLRINTIIILNNKIINMRQGETPWDDGFPFTSLIFYFRVRIYRFRASQSINQQQINNLTWKVIQFFFKTLIRISIMPLEKGGNELLQYFLFTKVTFEKNNSRLEWTIVVVRFWLFLFCKIKFKCNAQIFLSYSHFLNSYNLPHAQSSSPRCRIPSSPKALW